MDVLKTIYPKIEVVKLDSAQDGINKVINGEIYAYVDVLGVISYYMQKNNYTDIKIAGKIDIKLDARMATQLDEPHLNNILNKALLLIDDKIKQDFYTKWLSVKVEKVIDFKYLKELIFLVIFLALISGFWIRRLSKTQEMLKYKNMEFMSIFNETLNTVAIFEDNICVDINDSGVKLLGAKTKEELLGKSLLDFIALRHQEMALSKIQRNEVEPYEIVLIKQNNKEFPALLKHFTIENMKTKMQIISFMDLTEIKEKELSLELAKYKAEESTKAKSEFLANMSHEIRTPMNGIIGMTHLALNTQLNDVQKSYVKKIDISANSLLGVINDILDISKIEAGKLEIYKVDFDMLKLIERVRDVVDFKAKEKGLFFEINYEKNRTNFLYGDDLRISQIIINLLNNAIKFTSSGHVILNIRNENDSYTFEVIDSGIGMNLDQQRRLFESFSQLDASTTRKYGGSGLGLSISKQLVELMGGKIWVHSRLNQGTEFSFKLDIQKSKNDIKHEQKHCDIADILVLSSSQILLVEDNLINQEIILGFLQNTGIKVDVVGDGKEAIDIFRDNPKRYELILMDIQMPIMDGYEATKLIRNMDKNIPIIAISANAMNEDVIKSKNIGMNEHLKKPIEVEELYKVLLSYIPKKTNNIEIIVEKDEVVIPEFKNIDTKIGLSYLDKNKKLYMKILRTFYKNYHEFKIDNLEKNRFKISTHTIKSLSANIGATALHKVAKQLDTTQDKSHLSEFYIELDKVIRELKHISVDKITLNEEKEEVSHVKIEKLMLELKDAIKSHRPQKCEIIVAKIDKYRLSPEDVEIFESVKTLIEDYKFSEAKKLMEGIK